MLEPVQHHVELQQSHRADDRDRAHLRFGEEDLRRSFLGEFAQSLVERLAAQWVLGEDAREVLRCESRDTDILEQLAVRRLGCVGGRERVADPQQPAVVHADHVTGQRFFGEGPLATEKLLRRRELEALAGSHVDHVEPGEVPSRADAHEGDPIVMPRVHVGLHLEHEARERGARRRHRAR